MSQVQIRIRIFSFASFIHYFQFAFQAHWLLHSIVTRDTMLVPDRLDFFQVTEITFAHLIFRSQCLDTFIHCHGYRMPCYGNRVLMFVASYTTLHFIRLQSRPATHSLHHTPVFVQCLKIKRSACRNFKECGTVRIYFRHSQHSLHIPGSIAHSYRRTHDSSSTFIITVHFTYTCCTELDFHHTQLFDSSRFHTFQSITLVDILHIIYAFILCIIYRR